MSTAVAEADGVRSDRPRVRSLRWRPGERLGYALVAPAVLTLLAITGFPLFFNLWNSFHFDNLEEPFLGHPYVGLRNYKQVFASGQGLGSAVVHTLEYSVVSVSLEVAIGLGIALLLHRPMRGRGVYRTLILLPWAVPTVVAATVWKTLLDPQTGGVGYVLGSLGLPGAHTTWLNANALRSWVAIFVADAWQSIPFVTIILLAGLQGIQADLYEAAEVDGAKSWRRFTNITLPLLRPALLVVLVFRTLSAFMIFDIIYALTGGGPGTSTQTVAYLDYHAFLVSSDFGLGGAISIVMVGIALLIAAFYRVVLRPNT